MPSFSIPLSGLTASSSALSTTANNLANLNTIGYKDEQIQFADLFYQSFGTNGAGDPIQQGAGVTVSSKPSDFTQGNVTPTGVSTDVAVMGSGFFVVQKNNTQSYTRAGNFEVGTDNLLETAAGQRVLGYPAVNGVVNTGQGLGPLALGAGTISPATVTSKLQMNSNLDATAAGGSVYSAPQATIYDSLGASHQVTITYTDAASPAVVAVPAQAATGALTMSVLPVATQTLVVGSQTYTFTTSAPAAGSNDVFIGATIAETTANLVNAINGNYADLAGTATPGGYGTGTAANADVTAVDAGGGVINFTATVPGAAGFTATSSGTGSANLSWSNDAGANGVAAVAGVPAVINTWTYAITVPAADINGAAAPVTVGSGTLYFDGSGQLTSIKPTGGVASTTNPSISVPPTGNPQAVFADGANQLTFTWNVYDAAGKGLLTQLAGANSTSSIQQDGTSSGTLVNFSIGSDGTITGSFSNGKTATIGQIALASFADEQGLSHQGNNDFTPTLASGQPTIGGPGTGGLGTISGGALEQSNVDIASEFARLIIAQRSYEANARVVTTFDQVAQATIALKQ